MRIKKNERTACHFVLYKYTLINRTRKHINMGCDSGNSEETKACYATCQHLQCL